MDELQVY